MGGRYQKAPPEGTLDFQRDLLADWDVGRIRSIDVKGKFMYWTLGDEWSLWCTYGMSGQWSTERSKHSAVIILHRTTRVGVLEDCLPGICFNDPRHFGTLKFVKGHAALDKKLASLGPDMLSEPSPDEAAFRQALLRKHDRTLAEVMMNQSVVSGVGNYVKAEALYLAELSPHRLVRDLTTEEIERLRVQVINVMKASYNNGGATIRSYANVDGTKGEAQRRFAVYGNKEDLMGNPVTAEQTADGRTTWWVPAVQR